MTMTHGATLGKPDMTALEGEWGRRVFDAIVKAPKPDHEEIERRCREREEAIRKAKADGTY